MCIYIYTYLLSGALPSFPSKVSQQDSSWKTRLTKWMSYPSLWPDHNHNGDALFFVLAGPTRREWGPPNLYAGILGIHSFPHSLWVGPASLASLRTGGDQFLKGNPYTLGWRKDCELILGTGAISTNRNFLVPKASPNVGSLMIMVIEW